MRDIFILQVLKNGRFLHLSIISCHIYYVVRLQRIKVARLSRFCMEGGERTESIFDVHERTVKLAVGYIQVPMRNALLCPIKPNVLLQSRFAFIPSCCSVVCRKCCLDPPLTF